MANKTTKPEITKSQLITKIAQKLSHWSEKDVELGINKILDYMTSSLSKGNRIEIRGFGSFSLRYRPSRQAHNPKTGEKVITSPTYSPHFKPGKELREMVNAALLKEIKEEKK
jgi:integration host factor subunit beta